MTHRAKIIVGLLGIDQHEVGAIAISSLLRDAGVEVIYLGRFNTPASLIRVALHEDADVIGVSCHSWEYLEYIPELMTMLRSEAIDVDVVLGGSVITVGDAETMRQAGVAATFGAELQARSSRRRHPGARCGSAATPARRSTHLSHQQQDRARLPIHGERDDIHDHHLREEEGACRGHHAEIGRTSSIPSSRRCPTRSKRP